MVDLTEILALPYETRVELYKVIGDSLKPKNPTISERFATLRKAMEDVMGCSLDTETRKTPSVMARAMIAYQLTTEGFSTTKVGQVLNRDHATVIHYRQMIEDLIVYSRLSPHEFATWINFTNAIK